MESRSKTDTRKASSEVTEKDAPDAKRGHAFHPVSGALIIVFDVILWGGMELPTLELAAPIAALAGFLGVGTAVACVQKFAARDGIAKSLAKGLVGGVAAGVPTPVAGGVLGGLILSWSGLGLFSKMRRTREKD